MDEALRMDAVELILRSMALAREESAPSPASVVVSMALKSLFVKERVLGILKAAKSSNAGTWQQATRRWRIEGDHYR